MTFPDSFALAAGIILLCTFIRSAVGFGDALLAMPLLAMVIGLTTATPLVALVGLTISAAILATSWRELSVGDARRLIVSSVVGIPFGLLLLKAAPAVAANLLLGLILIGYGAYNLLCQSTFRLQSEKYAYPFGFVAGVLGAAYNTNGPPVVIYGTLRGWTPVHFRTTLQCYFFFTNVLIVISHGLAGFWTRPVIDLYLYSLPMIAIGIWTGGIVNRWIPIHVFRRLINGLLILVGGLFLVQIFF